MINIVSENINQIQIDLLKILSEKGKAIDVRNSKTLEIHPVCIELTNPKKRLTTLKGRNWNLPFAIGELAWHLSGSNDFDFISYYSKNWSIAIEEDESVIRESCYGNQIFSGQFSMWDRLLNEFDDDIHTRRAVLSLYDSNKSLGLNKKDVACTSTIQFLVRNDKLDCIVNMRSNDVIWGLPNDIFFVTMLQEWLSVVLNVSMGKYYHFIGSLHIYERHYQLMEDILDNPEFFTMEMPKMNSIDGISDFLNVEKLIRKGEYDKHEITGYWGDFLDILVLRSNKIADVEKHRIMNSSIYLRALELCPRNYIFRKQKKTDRQSKQSKL